MDDEFRGKFSVAEPATLCLQQSLRETDWDDPYGRTRPNATFDGKGSCGACCIRIRRHNVDDFVLSSPTPKYCASNDRTRWMLAWRRCCRRCGKLCAAGRGPMRRSQVAIRAKPVYRQGSRSLRRKEKAALGGIAGVSARKQTYRVGEKFRQVNDRLDWKAEFGRWPGAQRHRRRRLRVSLSRMAAHPTDPLRSRSVCRGGAGRSARRVSWRRFLRSVGAGAQQLLETRCRCHFIARLAALVGMIQLPHRAGATQRQLSSRPIQRVFALRHLDHLPLACQATKATLFCNKARAPPGRQVSVGFWDTVARHGRSRRDQSARPDTIRTAWTSMAGRLLAPGPRIIADASLSFVGNI